MVAMPAREPHTYGAIIGPVMNSFVKPPGSSVRGPGFVRLCRSEGSHSKPIRCGNRSSRCDMISARPAYAAHVPPRGPCGWSARSQAWLTVPDGSHLIHSSRYRSMIAVSFSLTSAITSGQPRQSCVMGESEGWRHSSGVPPRHRHPRLRDLPVRDSARVDHAGVHPEAEAHSRRTDAARELGEPMRKLLRDSPRRCPAPVPSRSCPAPSSCLPPRRHRGRTRRSRYASRSPAPR